MTEAAAYIGAPVRTAIGKFQGTLERFGAVQLGVIAARAALERGGIDGSTVGETFFGQARQANCGPNPGRQVSIGAGVPETAPAMTANQACASGMRAVALAQREVALGSDKLYLVGGMESMTNTPYMLARARSGYRFGHGELIDGGIRDGFMCPLADQLMGRTAETLAEQFDISRERQDEYAARSHNRAEAAKERLAEEIVPIAIPQRKADPIDFNADENPRDGLTPAKLTKLPPVFKEGGTVHAGNSSGITDGAAAMLVGSEGTMRDNGVEPLARIVDFALAGVDPKIMGIGPVPAVRSLLERNSITLSDIDLIELNEAFAAQVLACADELKLDLDKTNVNGGAIALGHPIGCTGARIVVTLLHEMKRRGARLGLATLCVSGGQGVAMLLELV